MMADDSKANQEIIQSLRRRRESVVQQLEAETAALNAASGGEVVRRQESWDAVAKQLKDIDDQLKKLANSGQQNIDQLIQLLNAELIEKGCSSSVHLFMPAYHKALSRRIIYSDISNVTSLIRHLVRDIKESSPNKTLYRFVRYLIQLSSDLDLSLQFISGLKEWEEKNVSEQELATIKAEIEREQTERSNQKNCLLIKVYSSSIDEYHVKAWSISDRHNYRQNWPEGAKPIRLADEPDASQTELVKDIKVDTAKAKLGHVHSCSALEIKAIIQRIHQKCCEQYAPPDLIEVFLPQQLMNTDIDSWQLQEDKVRPLFGTRYPVMLRSSDRLTRKYLRKSGHQKKWDAVERLLQSVATSTFGEGDPSDIDELYVQVETYSVLDAPAAKDVIGLKLTQPSSIAEEELEDLFETMLMESALPIMIWARQPEVGVECATSIDQVLSCVLERLPDDLKGCRLKAFSKKQKKQGCHIGNHLSLLWDDPQLIPPDSE